jgi:hypothetical protein
MNFRLFGFNKSSARKYVLLALLMQVAVPALAHHSTASFDSTQVIELVGTVKEFQWTNPHTWVQLMVNNAEGESVEWSIEGGSPGTLSRNGWKATSFKPGDTVTIRARPMINGAPGGAFVGAILADGSTLGR